MVQGNNIKLTRFYLTTQTVSYHLTCTLGLVHYMFNLVLKNQIKKIFQLFLKNDIKFLYQMIAEEKEQIC